MILSSLSLWGVVLLSGLVVGMVVVLGDLCWVSEWWSLLSCCWSICFGMWNCCEILEMIVCLWILFVESVWICICGVWVIVFKMFLRVLLVWCVLWIRLILFVFLFSLWLSVFFVDLISFWNWVRLWFCMKL